MESTEDAMLLKSIEFKDGVPMAAVSKMFRNFFHFFSKNCGCFENKFEKSSKNGQNFFFLEIFWIFFQDIHL